MKNKKINMEIYHPKMVNPQAIPNMNEISDLLKMTLENIDKIEFAKKLYSEIQEEIPQTDTPSIHKKKNKI